MSPRIEATKASRVILLDGAIAEPAILGGKGAALDRLIGWRLPVPRSAVATTGAYADLVAAPAIDDLIGRVRSGALPVPAAEVDRVFLSVSFAPDLAADLIAVARTVGQGRHLAVRSSATVEDLSGSSFAGQYRSLLDVDPNDPSAVLDAVRLVFASLWHPAPRAYRAAFGFDDRAVAMAAVLMQMVPAERAGVAFTEDPGGAAGSARVEAVDGLGEALVSGQRTPDAWIVGRDLVGFEGPEEVRQALELALIVERHEGRAQDVEWAWDGTRTWIVQARPITVAAARDGDGFDSAEDDAELTTAGIGEMLPGVLPPLRWQLCSHLVNEAFWRLVADLGAESMLLTPHPRPFVRRVRGRAAMDLDALRSLARILPGGSVDELEHQYFGSRRPGRPAAATGRTVSRRASIGHDLRSLRIERRASLDAEVVIQAVARLEPSPDLSMFDGSELESYRFRLFDLAARALAAELSVAAGATSAYRKVELILIPHLGVEEAGRWAERVTTSRGPAAPTSPAASAAVFAGPTWAELDREPPSSEALGRSRPDVGYAPEDDLFAFLRATPSWGVSGLRTALRARGLRQMIDAAADLLGRREATKSALLRLGGEVRRALLETGRRMADAGAIADPVEIELFTLAEIRAVSEGSAIAPSELASRRLWRSRYEREPPLPNRFCGQPTPEPVDLPDGGRLDGWAASPGRFTGVGFVVADPTEREFPPGGVLIAVATDASWSPLFIKAGAVVLERGGPLSHAAILARELGVPAVLNVPGATQLLSGETVTVDGDAGVVILHDRADRDPVP